MTKTEMSLSHTCLKKVSITKSFRNIHGEIFYPKIVLIEDNQTLRILDVEAEEDSIENTQYNKEISHHIVHDHLLWLAFSSGELKVINLKQNATITVNNGNYINYRIKQFVVHDRKLYFFTESRECLSAPLSTCDLDDKFNAGVKEVTVSFEKSHQMVDLRKSVRNVKNEVDMYIDSGRIVLKCLLTGLSEIVTADEDIKYISVWNNLLVLASHNNMWLVDEDTFTIVEAFHNKENNCLPLAADKTAFYYLLWNDKEIQICCVSLSDIDNPLVLRCPDSQSRPSSQESMMAQLQLLVCEASASKQTPSEVLPQLLTYYNKIEDLVFLINTATSLCNHNILYKAVLYQLQKRIFATNDTTCIDLFCDTMIKVDLLEYICFRGIVTYSNINIFEQNFVKLCAAFISNSDMDLASICWLKYSEMKPVINAENIVYILSVIPHNIKMGALVIWFRNFIPCLLEENPFFVDVFVKWTTERVFLLEQSSYWPKIGLKFIISIIDVLETAVKTINIRPISIDDLDTLKNHINYILELKEKYKINMLLSELSSQSPSEVALIMLRRCYTEDLEAFLRDNLSCYASRYLFEVDDMLRSFIESEAATSGGSVDGHRLQILLNAFRSPSNKLECLLQVLKVLDVPWNPIILNIATAAAALVYKDFTISDNDRTLTQEIYKELNYVKIKVILKKYNFPLTCTDYMLVINKLVNAHEVDVLDLKIVTSTLTAYTNYGNTLYIDRCLRDCDTKMGLEYFRNLSQRNKRLVIKTMLNKFEQMITGMTSSLIVERNYLDFLKGSQSLNHIQLKSIENLYHLKNSYSIKINLNDLYSEKNSVNQVFNWNRNNDNIASSGKGRCVMQLFANDMSLNTKLISLLQRTSTSRDIRKFLEKMILLTPGNENPQSVLSLYKDGQNSSRLWDSYDILSEIIQNCEEDNLHYLLHYLSILNAIINTNVVLKNLSVAWKFQYIFIPMTSINALNILIHFYANFSEESLSEFNLTDIFNRSDFVPFRIMTVMSNVRNDLEKSNVLKIRNKYITKLLTKILVSQELDLILVTGLLLILQHSEVTNDKLWILELLRGQSESLSPAVMNYLSSPLIRKTFAIEDILPCNILSFPPQYIIRNKFNINLDDITLPENNEETWDVKVLLFYILKQYPEMSFEKLIDMCQTLNVCESDGLSLLLISLLTNWELKYKIVEDDLGCRQLYLERQENDLRSKCILIWQNIENKIFLKDVLNDFWKSGEVIIHGCLVSINPYYYEVYLCIYQIMFSTSVESRNMKEYYLLNFLREYKRISAPKQYEFELFSIKGMFPEIGYYRLPFHLFTREDMWSNFKSEITLETYETWLPVVALLSLDSDLQTAKDMICSNAVKQTMTTRKRNDCSEIDSKNSEPWRLITREEPLLRTAHRCVKHIANMEWAGACLFYVLQGCARGADQVAAAQLCYQFSQRWASLQPDNRAVRQMERLHSTLSTRHVLHKVEWASEEFLRLTSEPGQLIQALYMHPDFIKKTARHDLNRAANEIADKNGINISSIRIQILENILSKSHKDHKYSSSLNINSLLTAKYILKATCPKMGAIYLSRIAFDDDGDHNKCKKLRALQCLMSLIEPENALKVTNREREVLWHSLLELLFIVDLEKIDMPWVVATFTQNKLLALNQLVQASNGNVVSLKIAAELAHKFGDTQVIRQLIPLMLRANIYDEVIPLLLKVLYPPDNIIYTAWRSILLTPFQKADYPITERQRSKCLNALNLLPVCPIIKDEDLVEIWKHSVRCKSPGLGCLILPYMTAQTRQTLTELQKIDKRNLIISLKNLHTETYLVSGAMYVLEKFTSKIVR